MIDLQHTSGFVGCLYCVSIVFVCQMTLLNVTLAILKNKFSQVKGRKSLPEAAPHNPYPIDILKKLNIY